MLPSAPPATTSNRLRSGTQWLLVEVGRSALPTLLPRLVGRSALPPLLPRLIGMLGLQALLLLLLLLLPLLLLMLLLLLPLIYAHGCKIHS